MRPHAVLDREQTSLIVLSIEAYDSPNTPSQRQFDFASVSINQSINIFRVAYVVKTTAKTTVKKVQLMSRKVC